MTQTTTISTTLSQPNIGLQHGNDFHEEQPHGTAAQGPSPEQAAVQEFFIQMMSGLWASRAVSVAAELGLADLVQDGPRTTAELATSLGAHAPSLYRLLRALAGMGVLVEDEAGRFGPTPISNALRTGVPGSMRGPARAQLGGDHYGAWGDLAYSVKTGEMAFVHHFGMPVWEFYARNPENARIFNDSMTSLTAMMDPAIVASYDFSGVRRLVDVGGGHGRLLAAILQANPHLTGVLFDQPEVAEAARSRIAEAGLAERCTVTGGDFFQAVPEGGDAYLMKWIIHDWDDERALAILNNCHRAMPEGSTILLVEQVLPERNEPSLGWFMDLNMMVMTGGQERTQSEFRTLLEAAGFRLTRIIPTGAPLSIVEAVRV